jgi:hypothetical protein
MFVEIIQEKLSKFRKNGIHFTNYIVPTELEIVMVF